MPDLKAAYGEFVRLLDGNYSTGDAMTEIQFLIRGERPIMGKVNELVGRINAMLSSYEKILGRREDALNERIESAEKAAFGAARLYDSLLKKDRPSLRACLPKISGAMLSESAAMRHPEKPEFAPENIDSLFDAARYMHGNSAKVIFEKMYGAHNNGKREKYGLLLSKDGDNNDDNNDNNDDNNNCRPKYGEVLMADLDGGAVYDSARGKETIVDGSEIVSGPLKAIEGQCGRFRFGMKVFAGRDFMNAQVGMGRNHTATVEAMIRKDDFHEGVKNYADNNYVRLRYIDSDWKGSAYRAGYMSKAMESIGFKVKKYGVRIDAELKGAYPDRTEKGLSELFRLLGSCTMGLEGMMDTAVERTHRQMLKDKEALYGRPLEKEELAATLDEAASAVVDSAVKEFERGNDNIGAFLLTLGAWSGGQAG